MVRWFHWFDWFYWLNALSLVQGSLEILRPASAGLRMTPGGFRKNDHLFDGSVGFIG
jgi:hypothetical protein